MICYRYHAFYGEEVEVVRRFDAAHHLVRLRDDVQLAIPCWMLDPIACGHCPDADHPRIGIAALLELRRLLDHQPLFHAEADSTTEGNSIPQGDPHAAKRSPPSS